MRIDVLTLFPEVFEPFFGHGIVGRAVLAGIARLNCVNFREFASDRHHTVDDRPFGGGPGMVLMCAPVFDAVEKLEADSDGPAVRVLLTPQGDRLTQATVKQLAGEKRIIVVCGHYEGFDERIRIGLGAREISIGDYVLSGGEPAALVLIDSIVRLLPGAVGDARSLDEESFASDRLEYPQYTRPREFRGMQVPEVLLSGDHGRIAVWRREQSLERTWRRRPDLMSGCPDGSNERIRTAPRN